MTDYYATLGVPADADADAIKSRYRKLAKENHPDLHPGNATAEARFKEIGEAWEVLGDPEKRAKYDAERAPKKTAAGRKKGSAPVGEVDFDKVMSQFDAFFGKAVKPPPGAKPRNPLDASDLFEKFMGVKR